MKEKMLFLTEKMYGTGTSPLINIDYGALPYDTPMTYQLPSASPSHAFNLQKDGKKKRTTN